MTRIISIYEAINIIQLVLDCHKVDGDNIILNASAIKPLTDVRNYLVSTNNFDIIRRNDMALLNETPEPPQGEKYEED
tara:strand:+ start:776 stop:1009 length:234 start_codon:yes stop_codon:yes gene_type:complete